MRTSDGEVVPRGQDVDWRSVGWPKVRHAIYEVHQRYAYAYTAPVSAIRQRLIMVPREDHGAQHLLEQPFSVTRAKGPVLSWQEDVFGNRVGRLRAQKVEQELVFEASYR